MKYLYNGQEYNAIVQAVGAFCVRKLCEECPLSSANNGKDSDCNSFVQCFPLEAASIIGATLIPETTPEAEANEEIHDSVNHPAHYTQGGIECIDAIAAATEGLAGIEAVDTAQVIKYIWRWKRKNGAEDLKKARWYLGHLINRIEAEEGENT